MCCRRTRNLLAASDTHLLDWADPERFLCCEHPPMTDLIDLRDRLRTFSDARDWDQFHSPKNLAMALGVEVAELAEHFQWLTEEQSADLSSDKLTDVSGELADVLIYLVRLADKLDVDLAAAASAKLTANEQRYPVDQSKGNAKKYTEFDR
jgi:dCTP diphosphatase